MPRARVAQRAQLVERAHHDELGLEPLAPASPTLPPSARIGSAPRARRRPRAGREHQLLDVAAHPVRHRARLAGARSRAPGACIVLRGPLHGRERAGRAREAVRRRRAQRLQELVRAPLGERGVQDALDRRAPGLHRARRGGLGQRGGPRRGRVRRLAGTAASRGRGEEREQGEPWRGAQLHRGPFVESAEATLIIAPPMGRTSSSEIPVLFRDEHLVVVSKPAGLLSVPTPGARGRTLPQVLREQGLEAFAVHRLDRDVSGALLLALDEPTRAALEELFRERALEKTYWALVRGHLRRAEGELKDPIADEGRHARISAAGKPALTRYRVLRELPTTSEVEIDLVTGRYNQIRLHFAHAGHALVGERKYARGKEDALRGAKRVALHAWRLAFVHPRTGAEVRVEAPLPAELASLAARAERAAAEPAAGARRAPPAPSGRRRPARRRDRR